ncbi:MAG: PcfJ domain-containing protein [Lachnospiraceae bacterium]|nr:PcfJ domain-containing protein [Lachnospiraceae bacterium]
MKDSIPIIDKAEYPTLDEMYYELMRIESYSEEAKKVMFPYVIKTGSSWYADIYIYIKKENRFERFIIAPNKKMSEEDEHKYINVYSEYEICICQRLFDFFMSEISEVAPELNVGNYKFKMESIIHIYYASFPSGVRELLYKIGLGLIANLICVMKDINDNSSNLEEAFGMPVKMLRKLNTNLGAWEILKDAKTREKAAEIYGKYHSLLNDISSIEIFQWQYLCDCYDNNEMVDKKMLKDLGKLPIYFEDEDDNSEVIYNSYLDYKSNIRVIEERVGRIFPRNIALDDPTKALSACKLAQLYKDNGYEYEQKLVYMLYDLQERYDYVDEEYIISPPESVAQMIKEAFSLKNCLCSYVIPFINRKTDILFMHRRIQPSKSYIAIEVRDGKLIQAREACNNEVCEKAMNSIRLFCKAKNLELAIA